MPPAKRAGRKPDSLTLRSYNVGFGDCFLLTLHYGKSKQRHVLIDFGSTGLPKNRKEKLPDIAADIAKVTSGKLHAVVATHRHKDHISGFATNKQGTAPGDIIRKLDPDVVIQPWTEHPDADPKARGPVRGLRLGAKGVAAARERVASLEDMQRISAFALQQIPRVSSASPEIARLVSFLGENNLKNLSAIKNLMAMGRRRLYVHFGAPSGLSSLLPGVKVSVLGPPTVDQSDEVLTQRSEDEDEFWHLQARALVQAVRKRKGSAFLNKGMVLRGARPSYARWFIPRLDRITGEQLLQIVREVDHALNNTSVILLFEVGKQALLFPGDAQIENWAFALDKPAIRKKLAGVTLYKVGHHGSLNATPKSLWALFANKGDKARKNRLKTVVSTLSGKHGNPKRGTEVPRKKLVDALAEMSDFTTTQKMKKGDLCHEITIPL